MAQNDIDLTPLNSQLASMSLEDCEYSNTLMERIFKQIDHENQCTDPTTVKMLCNMFNLTGKKDQVKKLWPLFCDSLVLNLKI
jgi:hypothetical protein